MSAESVFHLMSDPKPARTVVTDSDNGDKNPAPNRDTGFRLVQERLAEDLASELNEYLLSIGGVPQENGFLVQTTAGPLLISHSGSSADDFTVSTCFRDIQLAKSVLGYAPGFPHRLNPVTGQWDFAGRHALSSCKRAVSSILSPCNQG